MPKKPRSQRRKRGDAGDAPANADVDYLSESHTIVTLNSGANSNADLIEDDPSWNIDDDYVEADEGPSDQALQAAEQRHQKLVDALASIDDFATEKRSAKREQLLKLWFRALTQYASLSVSSQTLWDKREDLIAACRHGIRVGTPSEQYAACRVLEAAATLMSDDGYYQEVQLHLTRLVQSSHRAIPVRVAALKALAMAVFIGVDDEEITEQTLDLCESLIQKEYRGQPVLLTYLPTYMQTV